MPEIAAGWARSFFAEKIFSPGRVESTSAAPAEAAFVVKAMRLKRGQRLLDLCCGTGRHSLRLARKGIEVTGVDATPAYLREARRLSRDAANPRYLRGDMRRLSFDEEFDAAVNLWTSFGYFLDQKDDLKTLKGIARALKPGGLFLIEVLNPPFLREHFLGKNWRPRSDGAFVLEENVLREGRDPAVIGTWTTIGRGKRATARCFVRLYDRPRLSALLKKAGLTPLRAWGGLDGSPYNKESPRLALLSRK